MTSESQIIAIAKAHGYTDIRQTGGLITPKRLTGRIPNDSQRLPIPDYLNNRDAIHDVIKNLHWSENSPSRMVNFTKILYDIVDQEVRGEVGLEVLDEVEVCSVLICATAKQLSEAFLKTLGIWTEEPIREKFLKK